MQAGYILIYGPSIAAAVAFYGAVTGSAMRDRRDLSARGREAAQAHRAFVARTKARRRELEDGMSDAGERR